MRTYDDDHYYYDIVKTSIDVFDMFKMFSRYLRFDFERLMTKRKVETSGQFNRRKKYENCSKLV